MKKDTNKITFSCVKSERLKKTFVFVPKKYKVEIIKTGLIDKKELWITGDGRKVGYSDDDVLVLKNK